MLELLNKARMRADFYAVFLTAFTVTLFPWLIMLRCGGEYNIAQYRFYFCGPVFLSIFGLYLVFFEFEDPPSISLILKMFSSKLFRYAFYLLFSIANLLLGIHIISISLQESQINTLHFWIAALSIIPAIVIGVWTRNVSDIDMMMRPLKQINPFVVVAIFCILMNLVLVGFVFLELYFNLGVILLCIFGGFVIRSVTIYVTRCATMKKEISLVDDLIFEWLTKRAFVSNEERQGNRFLLKGKLWHANQALRKFERSTFGHESKEAKRLRFRLWLRQKKYKAILKEEIESNPFRDNYSQTLYGIRNMALIATGEYNKARSELENIILNEAVPLRKKRHLMVLLSELKYRSSDIHGAIALLERINNDEEYQTPPCVYAKNLLAFYYAELHRMGEESVVFLDQARDQIKGALSLRMVNGYPQLLHTDGFVKMVEGQFEAAFTSFQTAIFLDSHNLSHFHLGILSMIGTITYVRAEYHLRRAIAYFSVRSIYDESHNIMVANDLLENISKLRKKKQKLNQEIIMNYDRAYIPQSCFVKDTDVIDVRLELEGGLVTAFIHFITYFPVENARRVFQANNSALIAHGGPVVVPKPIP